MYAFAALFACAMRNGYTRTCRQIMQDTHMHKAVTGLLEAIRLLFWGKQSDNINYRCMIKVGRDDNVIQHSGCSWFISFAHSAKFGPCTSFAVTCSKTYVVVTFNFKPCRRSLTFKCQWGRAVQWLSITFNFYPAASNYSSAYLPHEVKTQYVHYRIIAS